MIRAFDTRLLAILVCPVCRGPLRHDPSAAELICEEDGLAFPIRKGTAVLLVAEARRTDSAPR